MADREKEQELLFEVESAGTEARVIAMCDNCWDMQQLKCKAMN